MKKQEDFEPNTPEEISSQTPAEPAAESAEGEAVEAVEAPAEDAPQAVTVESAEEPAEDSADTAQDGEEAASDTDDSADEKGKKKPFILQTPVIISCGIVLLALIGYLIFSLLFLRSPLDTVWMLDDGDSVYYFEFTSDGDFTTTRGTIQESIPYTMDNVDGTDTVIFHYPDGDTSLRYTVTGARALGNQEMTLYNDAGTYRRTLTQVKAIENPLELPADFTPDESLLGEWELEFGGTLLTVSFSADGSMEYKTVNNTYHYSQVYRGTYTVSDGQVSFTYCSVEPIVELLEYEVKGDTLYFLSMPFTRPGAATPDEG